MRPFELTLILTNLLCLLPFFNNQSAKVWWAVTGFNVLVLAIHSVVEGIRYQLVFSYLIVLLLTIFALLKSNRNFVDAKIPVVLKGLSFILIGISALLTYALPVFNLPDPTGPYAVGTTYLHLVDESRTEPFIENATRPREFMAKIYYPSSPDDSRSAAPYFNGSLGLVRLFTAHYGMPYFMFDHLTLVKTHAREGADIADEQAQYPIILFSHGAGTSMETQTAQSETLASHGYIVVAIDHTYASVVTVFPDRIVSAREATTDFNTADPADLITQIMAEDARFVIDELQRLNTGTVSSVFQGRLDLERIGAIGHSVGGAVAYNLLLNDNRVKAGLNLDGTVYVPPNGEPPSVRPFLMLANDQYHVQAIQSRTILMQPWEAMADAEQEMSLMMYESEEVYRATYDKAQQNMNGLADVLEQSRALYTIEGCDHMKFIDIGLFIGFPPLREMIAIRGDTAPARCLEITTALSVAFFDQYLKNAVPASVESLPQRYPELIKVDWE